MPCNFKYFACIAYFNNKQAVAVFISLSFKATALNNKTIYIRVQDHKPFKRLAKDLGVIDEYVQSNDCPKARISDKPHLTIARRLPAEVYEKAMMDYSQKIFHDFFPVRQLVLLRRDNEFGKYKTVNVFSLLPPDPNADGHQMNLFN